MRKIVFTLLASGVLLAVGSSVALADHHNGRHERRHGLAHRRHEAHHRRHEARRRVRHERLGSDDASQTTAGTIATFTGGVLTIKLPDGSTVSGRVTGATEIECEAIEPATMQADDRGDGGDRGDDGALADNGDRGDDGALADNGDRGDNGDRADNGEQGDPGDAAENCTAAALKPGVAVHEAELRVSSTGAIWDKVELLVQGTAGIDS